MKTKTKPKKVNKAKLLKKLKNQLWVLCKTYIRKKYNNNCYTCGAENITGVNCQTGHFIPSMLCPFELNYSPDNLRLQCMRCNKWSGGYGAMFYHNLLRDNGQEYINNLFHMLNHPTIIKPTITDYEKYIEYYKNILK